MLEDRAGLTKKLPAEAPQIVWGAFSFLRSAFLRRWRVRKQHRMGHRFLALGDVAALVANWVRSRLLVVADAAA
jgi:hypothetical protein